MTRRIDARAWLLWWMAASLPALVGRNPVPLVIVLSVILLVRSVVQPRNQIVSPAIIRLFLILATISVLFNVLTVHAGDIVLFSIPEGVPVFGGEVTLNAVIYGVLGALALLTLVLAGLTVAEQIEWAQVMRMLPDSLLGFGAAGSIALAFFPQMIASFREIREARTIRGAPLVGLRDYASLVAPMLSSGLDRAVTLSELLEIRAFGGVSSEGTPTRSRWLLPLSVTALVVATYSFFTGATLTAVMLAAVGVLILLNLVWSGRAASSGRTRFRQSVWTIDDTIVAVTSGLSILAVGSVLTVNEDALRYEPYPGLSWPAVSLPLVFALAGLAAPAIVALRQDLPDE